MKLKLSLLLACISIGKITFFDSLPVYSMSTQQPHSKAISPTRLSFLSYFFRPRPDRNKRYSKTNGHRYSSSNFGGACGSENKPLIAIAPGEGDRLYPIVTESESPILWFDLQDTASYENSQFEFTLINSKEKKKKNLMLTRPEIISTSIPGIVGIRIKSPLNLEEEYRWTLNLICNPDERDRDKKLNGELIRVAPSNNLASTNDPLKRIRQYAQEGIWPEVLTIVLLEIYPNNPDQGKQLLDQLRQDAGLSINNQTGFYSDSFQNRIMSFQRRS
jgi:hypothetical protein